MGTCPDSIKRLIDRFDQQSDQVRSPDYNETQLRIDFVNPMFAVLGWDIDNNQGFAEQYREVVHEDRVKVAGATKAPDYSFRVGGQRKYFLEAKKPAVNIKQNWEPAYQLRRYGWSAKLAVSLLTDFEELAIYDCRVQPKLMEKASVARRDFIAYRDYPDRWGFIVGTFSKDAVLRGEFDRYCATKKGRGAQEFDEAFLEEIEEWRKALASNLALRNKSLSESELNFAVQRIIDRIIFLRMAEDRGTETTGQLQALLNGEKIYDRLCKLFRDADARYNSGLFHFATEKGRDEAPDTLTPRLEIDDKPLKNIFKRLYYPESPYEFTVVTADILGSVYERFLGKVITLTDGHRAKIEEKPEVRKAGGVYYTPTYIVDYIVKNTVGKLLGTADNADAADSKSNGLSAVSALSAVNPSLSPKDASNLKFLDPACGSGSFLIGAYQFLLDWYLQQYIAANPAQLATGKHPVLRPAMTNLVATAVPAVSPNAAGTAAAIGGWKLTIAERKRILLDHIHGVDLDGAAVEVTKLNLLLKCLEGETSQSLGFEQRLFRERALPDLGKNILCGNSLIGTDIIGTEAWNAMTEEERRRINPFDYERAFPGVFKGKDGGFDAVIGNPPYVRQESIVNQKPYLQSHFASFDGVADLYVYFIEKGLKLLVGKGRFSIIVSSSFLRTTFASELRQHIATNYNVESIVDFGGLAVFEDAKDTYVCIPTITKSEPGNVVLVASVNDTNGAAVDAAVDSATGIPTSQLKPTAWSVDSPATLALLGRLNTKSKTLGEIANGRFFRGITSGLNDAFVIDRETRKQLLVDDPASAAVIKPFLRGEDVRRYHTDGDDLYILFPRRGINISQYKAVERHLGKWKAELMPRTSGVKVGRKSGAYRWYEIQDDTAYYEMFDQPKIIYPDIAKGPRFVLDESGFYPANTVYCLGLSDKRLLGFLNSKLFWFCISKISIPFGTRAGKFRYRLISQYMEQIPVAIGLLEDSADTNRLTALVDTMLTLHKRLSAEQLPQRREQIQREIDATDRQIDQLVYQLYGLTDGEIRIVEEATK